MSECLEAAALLDPERAASLAETDAEMGIGNRVMRAFRVAVKSGHVTRIAFEAFGTDAFSVTMQHMGLKRDGEYIVVRPLREVAA